MTNIFLELKNMNHQLSNALSTMLLRRLDMLLHFETYVFKNTQKPASSPISGVELDFLPHIYLTNFFQKKYIPHESLLNFDDVEKIH